MEVANLLTAFIFSPSDRNLMMRVLRNEQAEIHFRVDYLRMLAVGQPVQGFYHCYGKDALT
jgi:hypothetical protein